MKLKLKALNALAMNTYANHQHFHEGDSGLDLFVLEDVNIPARAMVLVGLGIACAAYNEGEGTSYLLMPRSSICKTPLRMANSIGLIDKGYRGEIKAPLDNISNDDYLLKAGTRIVQLVAADLGPISVCIVDELDSTNRGAGGFGSTGV